MSTRLQHDGLAQWVMAVHQPVIAFMQPGHQSRRRHREELPVLTAIAARARQNKIPNAISVGQITALLEYPREKVIDVRASYRDLRLAIETAPLLIAIQGRASTSEIYTADALNE